MKKQLYTVTLRRSTVSTAQVDVIAPDERKAEDDALMLAADGSIDWDDSDDEVEAIGWSVDPEYDPCADDSYSVGITDAAREIKARLRRVFNHSLHHALEDAVDAAIYDWAKIDLTEVDDA